MSNLLDKASIILTPTAYNNGEALCVKPSDGSGDFDFSRNSAATRVNAQGLVENVQILSSNLVQNGDFSEEGVQEVSNGSFSQEGSEEITNGDFSVSGTPNTSSWALGWYSNTNNVEIANGKLTLSNSAIESASRAYATNGVNSNNILTTNKFYKLQYDIVENNGATDLKYYSANGSFISVPSVDVGSYTLYIQNTSNSLFLFQLVTSNSSISIDNVSVKEVGQDWSLGGEVTIGDNLAHFESNTNTYSYIRQDISSLTSKTYKIQLEVKNYVSGAVQVAFSGASPITQNLNVSTDGVYTAYLTPNANGDDFEVSREFNGGNFNFDITNISVKEVGQNWTLNTGWSIGEDKAVATSGSASKLQQPISGLSGKTCKVSFTLSDYGGSGKALLDFGSTSGQDITSNGTYTEIGTYDQDYFQIFKDANFTGSITNISVIEITDDTNLPRINYEGFSYQDALGNELVTNGDFNNGTNNWINNNSNLSVESGKLKVLSTSGYGNAEQNISVQGGKTYNISVDFTYGGTTDGRLNIYDGTGLPIEISKSEDGIISTQITISSGQTNLRIRLVNQSATIGVYNLWDNVSVKEYLGQEVVPESGCGSWLFEPQSTNLVTYSEDFSDASWVKEGGAIIELNTSTSPDGSINASYLKAPITTNNTVRITNTFSTTSSQTYLGSIFVKKDNIDYIRILSTGATASTLQAFYNVSNGTLGSAGTPSKATIEDFGNGWYRLGLIIDAVNTTSNATFRIQLAKTDGAVINNFDGTEKNIIWGAQLEQQSYATSYIPTSGSTVTRNQDVCTNGGSLASINSTSGVLYAEIAALADGGVRMISISDGSANNQVSFEYSVITNLIRVRLISQGVEQSFYQSTSYDYLQYHKIAISYKLNNFKIYIDGTEIYTDTSSIMPIGLNELSFANGNGASNFFGKTKCLAIFPILTDAELTELTTI